MRNTCLLVKLCLVVAARAAVPTDEPPAHYVFNNQNSDTETVTAILRSVSEQLEKFNTLYVGKLESRILSVATLLTNIDSNVKHLQERAHVWDTFQLHVSAWNEQIKSLDRKVDIINRGQEQLPVLDGKVTQLLTSEETLTRLASRVDDVDVKLAAIAKSIEDSGGASAVPLLGEFAARGVLSTLKNIERKVERLSTQIRHEEKHSGGESGGGRLVVKCQTPPTMEALLHDVSSKVDVLFDRFNDEDVTSTQFEGESELRSGESAVLSRVFRRLASPLRRTWRALEGVERALRGGEETSAALKQTQRDLLTVTNRTLAHALQGSECCASQRDAERSWRLETGGVLREIKDALHNASLEREQMSLHLDEINIDHNVSCGSLEPKFTTSSEELDSEEDESLTSSTSLEDNEATPAPPRWMCHELLGTESGVTDPLGDIVTDEAFTDDERDLLFCDQKTSGGGWTVVQRRGDYGQPRENFTKEWRDYERGFGDLNREFWAGLTFIHSATIGMPMKLRVELADFEGNETFAEYSTFRVGGPDTQYQLRIKDYSGNATDSFSAHDRASFSTIDRDNDEAPECCPCAPAYGGGWWFYSCFEANLNGEYHDKDDDNSYFRGIIWEHWRGDYSLARVEMKIRPLDFEPR